MRDPARGGGSTRRDDRFAARVLPFFSGREPGALVGWGWDGTRRAAISAPVAGWVSLKSLEPWGRSSAISYELSNIDDDAYWPPSESDSDDDGSARAYDPNRRWAAGARSYAATLPSARDALAAAEAGICCGIGNCRLSWPSPRHGVRPFRGLRCSPRGTVAGRVSVLCPTTFQRREFHGLLLANVRRQTWRDVEFVVFDDAPTPSPSLAAAEDVVYVRAPMDSGVSLGEKRNRMMALATGEFVANFDDDNVYAATYLSTMIDHLRASGAGLVSLELAFTATLTDALRNADLCRRLAGFGCRGETFVHYAVAPCAALYAPLNVGEEIGLLENTAHHALVDDRGLFLHVDHGTNTVALDLRDATGEVVDIGQIAQGDPLPADAPLRVALGESEGHLRDILTVN